MSDDEADLELVELLRQSLGLVRNEGDDIVSSQTGVLNDAEYIYHNAIDVSIDMIGTKAAAQSIYESMQDLPFAWAQHELHPGPEDDFSEVDLVNFIFTMDLLNFSFWSCLSESDRYQVRYRDKQWTGYSSLVASLRRALEAGIPITTPNYWNSAQASDEVLRNVFASSTEEQMPLLQERIDILREAGRIFQKEFGSAPESITNGLTDSESPTEKADDHFPVAQVTDGMIQADSLLAPTAHSAQIFEAQAPGEDEERQHLAVQDTSEIGDARHDGSLIVPETATVVERANTASTINAQDASVLRLIEKADHSAGKLVNLLAKYFPSFRDETRFDSRRVRLMKRAQIFVADIWAALDRSGYGRFDDIDCLTMFADYRVPQMLQSLEVIVYSPPLYYHIADKKIIASGHSWEVQLRGCSIWAVELIKREILKQYPNCEINAVLLDFFLYDLAKAREKEIGSIAFDLPHHRTRSIWY